MKIVKKQARSHDEERDNLMAEDADRFLGKMIQSVENQHSDMADAKFYFDEMFSWMTQLEEMVHDATQGQRPQTLDIGVVIEAIDDIYNRAEHVMSYLKGSARGLKKLEKDFMNAQKKYGEVI